MYFLYPKIQNKGSVLQIETKYIVYIHKNKANGKVYIGITGRQNPYDRWGKNGMRYKNQVFGFAIKKYGWDNFEHIILFSGLSKKEAEKKEIELIKTYDSTNIDKGYNIQRGGNLSLKPPVYQYDRLTGILLNVFDTTISAQDTLGIPNADICAVCNGRVKSAHDYYFSYKHYENGVPNDILTWINKNDSLVKVAKYDTNGNFIKIYNSKADANEEFFGSRKSRINFNEKVACGFIWKTVNNSEIDYTQKLDDNEVKSRVDAVVNNKICYKYDLYGNFICEYRSTTEAGKQNGLTSSPIASACREHTKSGNFYWRYATDIKYGVPLPSNELYDTVPGLFCRKRVIKYDLSGKKLCTYDSVTDASNTFDDCSTNNISLCCKRKIKQSHGFIWRYENDPLIHEDLEWCKKK